MASLPIVSSPQASANTANAANTANTSQKNGATDAKSAEPFGNVLARQIDAANAPASNETAPAAGTEIKTDAKTKATTNSVNSKLKAEQDKALSATDQAALNLPSDPASALVAMLQLPPDLKTPVAKDAASDATAARSTNTRKAAADQAASNVPAEPSNALVAMLQPVQDIKTPVSKDAANDTAATRSTAIVKTAGNVPSTSLDATQDHAQAQAQANISAASGKTEAAIAAADKLALRTEINVEQSKPAELPNSMTSAAQSAQNMAQVQSATSGIMPNMLTANQSANNPQTIATPLNSNGWADEFSQKISWMSTQQNQVAELHLNPPDLGPLDVVLKISDNQATAMFTSPHSAVRDAIENALPKLREVLADNGIMLGNTTVSDQTPRDSNSAGFMNQRGDTPGRREIPGIANESTSSSLSPIQLTPASRHNGMVDTFA